MAYTNKRNPSSSLDNVSDAELNRFIYESMMGDKEIRADLMDLQSQNPDELSVLKKQYTKTPNEITHDRFTLSQNARTLYNHVHTDVQRAPRDDKHILGRAMLECSLSILKHSVIVKRRISSFGPVLDQLDVELDVLRDYYEVARTTHPGWIDYHSFEDATAVINNVGSIVGGLLKAGVAN